jgi:hypothetical protein
MTLGYGLAIAGLGLLLIFGMCVLIVGRFYWKVLLGMPVGQWVPFGYVCKLGCPPLIAKAILYQLFTIGTVSVRIPEEYIEMLLDELEEAGLIEFVGPEDESEDAQGLHEITLPFEHSHAEFYEYMLHRRPRRRRRVTATRTEAIPVGSVPARA